MAFALIALSAVTSIAGAAAQSSAYEAQAQAQQNIAEFNAQQNRQAASQAQAAGQAQAALTRQDAEVTQSRAVAAQAESGVSTTFGSSLLLDQKIAAKGEYQSDIDIANAGNKSAQLETQARSSLYQGTLQANASRYQAETSLLSGFGGALSSVGRFAFG